MKTIIHIDNSEFFRKIMRNFLSKEGFEVEGYDKAEDANIAISGGAASMVIAGLAIAGVEGDDFVRRIIESYAGPVIILSSSIDRQNEDALLALGVKAAINKAGAWQVVLKPYLDAIK
jgi:DNA-binding response OmpR family regulator